MNGEQQEEPTPTQCARFIDRLISSLNSSIKLNKYCYIVSTSFYPTLNYMNSGTCTEEEKRTNSLPVKSQLRGVNFHKCQYILMPVFIRDYWILAGIYAVNKLYKFDKDNKPCIIIFDVSKDEQHNGVVSDLKDFLRFIWKWREIGSKTLTASELGEVPIIRLKPRNMQDPSTSFINIVRILGHLTEHSDAPEKLQDLPDDFFVSAEKTVCMKDSARRDLNGPRLSKRALFMLSNRLKCNFCGYEGSELDTCGHCQRRRVAPYKLAQLKHRKTSSCAVEASSNGGEMSSSEGEASSSEADASEADSTKHLQRLAPQTEQPVTQYHNNASNTKKKRGRKKLVKKELPNPLKKHVGLVNSCEEGDSSSGAADSNSFEAAIRDATKRNAALTMTTTEPVKLSQPLGPPAEQVAVNGGISALKSEDNKSKKKRIWTARTSPEVQYYGLEGLCKGGSSSIKATTASTSKAPKPSQPPDPSVELAAADGAPINISAPRVEDREGREKRSRRKSLIKQRIEIVTSCDESNEDVSSITSAMRESATSGSVNIKSKSTRPKRPSEPVGFQVEEEAVNRPDIDTVNPDDGDVRNKLGRKLAPIQTPVIQHSGSVSEGDTRSSEGGTSETVPLRVFLRKALKSSQPHGPQAEQGAAQCDVNPSKMKKKLRQSEEGAPPTKRMKRASSNDETSRSSETNTEEEAAVPPLPSELQTEQQAAECDEKRAKKKSIEKVSVIQQIEPVSSCDGVNEFPSRETSVSPDEPAGSLRSTEPEQIELSDDDGETVNTADDDNPVLIVYPSAGDKQQDNIGTETVHLLDYHALDDGNYLNDAIINFYLKYILLNNKSVIAFEPKVHIFNTYFYSKLTQHRDDGGDNVLLTSEDRKQQMHSNVKNWTKNIDIFGYDYLVVPVNLGSHWFVMIISFPWIHPNEVRNHPQVIKQFRRPCIYAFDSIGENADHKDVVRNLQGYLEVEYSVKHSDKPPRTFKHMVKVRPDVPEQQNSYDCGTYVLQYVETFLMNAFIDHRKLPCLLRWFKQKEVQKKRKMIADLIRELMIKQDTKTDILPKLRFKIQKLSGDGSKPSKESSEPSDSGKDKETEEAGNSNDASEIDEDSKLKEQRASRRTKSKKIAVSQEQCDNEDDERVASDEAEKEDEGIIKTEPQISHKRKHKKITRSHRRQDDVEDGEVESDGEDMKDENIIKQEPQVPHRPKRKETMKSHRPRDDAEDERAAFDDGGDDENIIKQEPHVLHRFKNKEIAGPKVKHSAMNLPKKMKFTQKKDLGEFDILDSVKRPSANHHHLRKKMHHAVSAEDVASGHGESPVENGHVSGEEEMTDSAQPMNLAQKIRQQLSRVWDGLSSDSDDNSRNASRLRPDRKKFSKVF